MSLLDISCVEVIIIGIYSAVQSAKSRQVVPFQPLRGTLGDIGRAPTYVADGSHQSEDGVNNGDNNRDRGREGG